MGVHIAVKNTHSHPASVTSEEEEEEDYHDELDTASHAPSAGVSSPYSVHPQSNSSSSNHPSQFELHYPNEIPPHVGELHPSDSASRLERRERAHNSRPSSLRRDTAQRRQHHPQAAARSRQRQPEPESTSESEDSTEDFIQKPEYDIGTGMPRPTSYYGPNGYTQSNSSGASYGYPPVPHSNQIVPYPPPHQPGAHPQYGHPQHPHHSQPHQPYPPVASPPPHGYPPNQTSHHPQSAMSYNPPSHAGHVAPPYTSPYGPPSIIQPFMPPVPSSGYFPPGYGPPPPHQYGSQYHQLPPHLYAHQQMPPLPEYMNAWRTRSPHPGASVSSSSSDKPPAIDQEEIMKRFEALLTAKDDEKKAAEAERQEKIRTAEDQLAAIRKAEQERHLEEVRIRAEALKAAHEQAEAAAKAHNERLQEEARIRKEATEAAKEAIAAAAAAAAEQNAREARIREDAARAALEKAAADAQAKAEQEAKEAKIASDAADAAKSSAEKAAAEAAAAAQEAAKKEKDEAEKKLKEAEEESAKAKKEAEDAQAAVAAAKPPDKQPPVRFKDAIGRNYNFPWERCHKWRDMEGLIIQAFQHIQDLGQHVIEGRYDLIGPDKEIIMPEYWDVTVQPDMHITMMLWPIPEPPPEPEPAPAPGPPLDGVIDLDELLNPKKNKKNKKGGGIGNAFGNWMLGGAPSRPRKPAGKDIKKPEGAHHDAVEIECIVL